MSKSPRRKRVPFDEFYSIRGTLKDRSVVLKLGKKTYQARITSVLHHGKVGFTITLQGYVEVNPSTNPSKKPIRTRWFLTDDRIVLDSDGVYTVYGRTSTITIYPAEN